MGDSDPDASAVQPFLSSIHYCAEGVKNDFQRVVDRFLADESVRYADFLSIWQQLQFQHIYRGRQSREKLRQFTEEVLRLATELWIESSDFQVQVCGLYLLYGLYFCQPVEPKIRIRMTLPMWQAAKTFITSVKEFHHYDVEYIFMKLTLSKSFYFVATLSNQNALQDDDYRRKKILSSEEKGAKETPTLIQNLLKPDNILKLEVIDQQYQQMKKNLDDGRGAPDLSLSVIQTDLLASITNDVKTFKSRQLGPLNRPPDQTNVYESSARAKVKEKATAAQQKLPKRTSLSRKSKTQDEVNEDAVGAAVISALGKSAYPVQKHYMMVSLLPSVADLNANASPAVGEPTEKKAKQSKGKGTKYSSHRRKGKRPMKRPISTSPNEGHGELADRSTTEEAPISSPKPSTSKAGTGKAPQSTKKRTPRNAKSKTGDSGEGGGESLVSKGEPTPPTQRRKSTRVAKIKPKT